jgi:hypothetical protein
MGLKTISLRFYKVHHISVDALESARRDFETPIRPFYLPILPNKLSA